MKELCEIYFWQDGTWCYKEEYSSVEYGWKSDDFGRISLPLNYNEHDIQEHIDYLTEFNK